MIDLKEVIRAWARTPEGRALGVGIRDQLGLPQFRIDDDPQAVGGQTITCLRCGMKSYHPKDVEHRYCANCDRFHEDQGSVAEPGK